MRYAFTALVLGLFACGDADPGRDSEDAAPDSTDVTGATDVTDSATGELDELGETGDAEPDTDAADATADDGDSGSSEDGDVATDIVTIDATTDVALPEVVVSVVRPPEVGELVITEVMIDPVGRSDLIGEWVELVNLTDDATLDVADCWLADGDGRRATLGDGIGIPRVRPGDPLLLARSAVPDDNGDLAVDLTYDAVLMSNAAGSIAIGCGDVTHHQIAWDTTWPLAPGRALVLPAGAAGPDEACAATELYDALNRGTPGALDAECPAPDLVVDDCGIISPEAGRVPVKTPLEALVWIVEAGATDLSPGIDAIPWFRAEIGLAANDDALVWTAAEPRPLAQRTTDPAMAARDHHGLVLPELDIGAWTVSARFSLDRGASWRTCGERVITVEPSPCDPNPCVGDGLVRCDDDVLEAVPATGQCSVVPGEDGDEAACTFVAARTDCAALAGRCDDAGLPACVDVAGPPAPGEIVITEVMKNPNIVDDGVGEWIELTNVTTRPLQLAGCTLVDDATDSVALAADDGALTIWPGDYLVLAASADPSDNGGIEAAWGWAEHGTFELLNASDAVVLRCGGVEIDQVRYTQSGFPTTTGRAMQLSPKRSTAVDNDVGSAWCTSASAIQTQLASPDYGTPGRVNGACQEAVQRCRLVAAPTLEVVAGTTFDVHVQVRHPGLTDLGAGTDVDPWVRVEAGTGVAGWYPTWSGWTWAAGSVDAAWSDDSAPLEDQWTVTLVADPDEDELDVSGRVSVDGGLSWSYCDRDSTAPGGDGSEDGYQTQNATRVTVVPFDPCSPNPCTDGPPTECDGDGRLVTYPALGECTPTSDGAETIAQCDYLADVVDCPALSGVCDALAGACVGAIGGPVAGEIVVSEVMSWPVAVGDFFGEWIELTNVALAPVNLAGCTLSDAALSIVIDVPGDALVIAAGAQLVLGREADGAINGGVAVDFAWGDALGLGQAGDTITLACDDVIIDTLAWDDTFPFAAGVAMQLDAASVDATLNDDALAWCAATTPYGAGDLGTPGAVNEACAPP